MEGHHAADLAGTAASESPLSQQEHDNAVRLEIRCTQQRDAGACRSWRRLLEKVCPRRPVAAPRLPPSGDDGADAAGPGPAKGRPSEAWACFDLAQLYSLGLPDFDNAPLAASYYQQACDGKHYRGCYNLAMMYSQGLGGLPRDAAKAVQLLEHGCDKRHAQSCTRAAEAYQRVKRHRDSARCYDKACALGNLIACANLGLMRRHGLGVPKDEAVAVDLLRKACDGGLPGQYCADLPPRGAAHERT